MDSPLQSVTNATRVLRAFLGREEAQGPSELLGVSDLARRLGLGKSAVHRLLATLAAEGFVERDPATGLYRLGLLVFELGQAVRVHADLHAAAGPVLVELREQTGESSQVGMLDGDSEVVYVDRLESSHSLRLFHAAGRRVPVHCTSSGKVLLAHLPAERREAVLAGPLRAHTPHTLTDPELLRAELVRVHTRGWADAVDEREVGLASLAAPVRGPEGHVVAAISIGAPVTRFRAIPRKRLARWVVEAGEAVSRRLGWSPEESQRSRAADSQRPQIGSVGPGAHPPSADRGPTEEAARARV